MNKFVRKKTHTHTHEFYPFETKNRAIEILAHKQTVKKITCQTYIFLPQPDVIFYDLKSVVKNTYI